MKKREGQSKKMRIALVGGGEGLLTALTALRSWCIDIPCYFSPRHGRELINGIELRSHLSRLEVSHWEAKGEKDFAKLIENKEYDLVFGMGPEWIFSSSTLGLAGRWVNINIIPFPRYLGGAHVTWQILNGDIEGSVVFQEMIKETDKGEVLAKYDFLYSSTNDSPIVRFARNQEELGKVLPEFMVKFSLGKKFQQSIGASQIGEYWPRLSTEIQGWIDWNWSALDILRFINAFSSPYPGARTRLENEIIVIRGGRILESREFHPFSSGIILRSINGKMLTVACRDAVLELDCEIPSILENTFLNGSRLFTPLEDLEVARRRNLKTRDFRVPK